jgi:integrase/recombinase XerD
MGNRESLQGEESVDLQSWLQPFAAYLIDERGIAQSTQQSYQSDLADFLAYTDSLEICEPNELKAHHITAYLSQLKRQGRSAATISRRIVSIRTFCKFLTVERAVNYNPAMQVESPKVEKNPPVALTSSELDRLLQLPDTAKEQGLRDRAILELLYATGLRATEMTSLNVKNIRLDMGFLLCLGSGGRERMVPIGSYGAFWVTRYLNEARGRLVSDTNLEQDALFVNHAGQRLTRQGFWKIIKKYANQLGIEMTPNTLRHSFAAHMLENGADIRAVQEMMGHSAASSTQIYQTAAKVKIKEVYDRSHPRARTD